MAGRRELLDLRKDFIPNAVTCPWAFLNLPYKIALYTAATASAITADQWGAPYSSNFLTLESVLTIEVNNSYSSYCTNLTFTLLTAPPAYKRCAISCVSGSSECAYLYASPLLHFHALPPIARLPTFSFALFYSLWLHSEWAHVRDANPNFL